MTQLTRREQDLVRLIIQWHKENNGDVEVERDWLKDKLKIEDSRLSALRGNLVGKGIIRSDRGSFILAKGLEEILIEPSRRVNLNVAVYLPLRGQVRAGKTSGDELRIDLSDVQDESALTIPIPHLADYSGVYLLEVVGNSMMHEHILPGDYAIVKWVPSHYKPKQRELIVTRYLPICNEPETEGLAHIDHHMLYGPTIKYFTEVADKERSYRLSWKTEIRNSSETIETKYIYPEGVVMGMYRPINKY